MPEVARRDRLAGPGLLRSVMTIISCADGLRATSHRTPAHNSICGLAPALRRELWEQAR